MKRIDFLGKNVLITGASTGIGKALSVEFAERGANLALGSLPQEKQLLEDHAKHLETTYNIKTQTFPLDLLTENAPEILYQQVSTDMGDIFALVNNAGTVAYGKFWEIQWERRLKCAQLNFHVPLRLMHLFLPGMVERGEGVILNITSVSALQPTPFQAVYGATKAGLQSLSEAVREELKGTGVTVCTLNPPYIDTELLKRDGYPPNLRFYSISGKKSSEWLARKALNALEKRKFLYVPGLKNFFLHNLLIKLSPRRLVNTVSRFFMQDRGGAL
jgi:short-subunit dehydrogenase